MPRLSRGPNNKKIMKESRIVEISIPNLEAIDEDAYKFMTEMGDLTVYA